MGEIKTNEVRALRAPAGKEATWMQCLGPNGIFGGLDPAEREIIAKRARRRHFAAGELLFQEGDRCAGLHIVATGRVRIFKSSPSGREQVLAIEGPGSTVAELPVFDGGSYPASSIAIEETEIMFLPREEFRAFCLERPEVALKVLAAVGARLRQLVDLIEELSFTTVRQRLAATLVRLAKNGKKESDGIAFDLPDSHQEMAHKMGTVRELVSRNLTRLAAEGMIKLDGRHILVRDENGIGSSLDTNRHSEVIDPKNTSTSLPVETGEIEILPSPGQNYGSIEQPYNPQAYAAAVNAVAQQQSQDAVSISSSGSQFGNAPRPDRRN